MLASKFGFLLGSMPPIVCDAGISSSGQKQSNGINVSLPNRLVKWRVTILSARINFSSGIKEQSNNAGVAANRGNMKRRISKQSSRRNANHALSDSGKIRQIWDLI